MLKFCYDHKGELSVFTLFVLIPVMVFAAVLMDFARLQAIRAQQTAAAETAANSFLSLYDETLNDMYGLFAVTQEDEQLKQQLTDYIKASFDPSSKDFTSFSDNSYLAPTINQIMTYINNDKQATLNLTKNALYDLNLSAGTALNVKNERDEMNVLRMQISEYIKYIGPTELLFNTADYISDMLKPSSDNNGNNASDTEQKIDDNATVDAVKNSNEMKELLDMKNEADQSLQDLDNELQKLNNSLNGHEYGFRHLINNINRNAAHSFNIYNNGTLDNLVDFYYLYFAYINYKISDIQSNNSNLQNNADALARQKDEFVNKYQPNTNDNDGDGLNDNFEDYLKQGQHTSLDTRPDKTNKYSLDPSRSKTDGDYIVVVDNKSQSLSEYASKWYNEQIKVLEEDIQAAKDSEKSIRGDYAAKLYNIIHTPSRILLDDDYTEDQDFKSYLDQYGNIEAYQEGNNQVLDSNLYYRTYMYADSLFPNRGSSYPDIDELFKAQWDDNEVYARYMNGKQFNTEIYTDTDIYKYKCIFENQPSLQVLQEFGKNAQGENDGDDICLKDGENVTKLIGEFASKDFSAQIDGIRQKIGTLYGKVEQKIRDYEAMGVPKAGSAEEEELNQYRAFLGVDENWNYDYQQGIIASYKDVFSYDEYKGNISGSNEPINIIANADYSFFADRGIYQTKYTKAYQDVSGEFKQMYNPDDHNENYFVQIEDYTKEYFDLDELKDTNTHCNEYYSWLASDHHTTEDVINHFYSVVKPTYERYWRNFNLIRDSRYDSDYRLKNDAEKYLFNDLDASQVNRRDNGGYYLYKDVREAIRKLTNQNPNKTQEEEKKKIDKSNDSLKKLMDEKNLEKIIKSVQPRCKRSLPEGIGQTTENDPNKTGTDLVGMNEKGGSTYTPAADNATRMVNKLLLMMYDFGMFTCHTSDYKQDKPTEEPKRVQPHSFQTDKTGYIKLATAKSKEKPENDGYNESKTDYLLYAEMEYIFNGNRDSVKNFNAVRNYLAIIRFVPNYISTYSVNEINNIANTIRNTLSWCPIAAIVAEQLFRVLIAALETWCDLSLLFTGHSVIFYKSEMKDMSMIGVVKSLASNKDNKDFQNAKNDLSSSPASGNKDIFSTDTKTSDSKKIRVNYQQYLLVLNLLFVDQEVMLSRTADLIEVNMNYTKGFNVEKNLKEKQWQERPWKMDKAYTVATATVSTNSKPIFIGNGSESIFNTRDYEQVTDLENSLTNNDPYAVKVTATY